MSDKMRSRTEMVTTTFVDSEEDYSDDDDSEEDWRPSASSKNGKNKKQQKGSSKRGRKRKGSSGSGNKNSKRKASYEEESDEDGGDEGDEPSEDEYDYDDFETISGPSSKKPASLPPKKQFSDRNSSTSGNENEAGDTLTLLVYVKDLTGSDFNKNNRLCLWRKDNNNLLQKYIRVKTSPEEFLFTSSSVYSSFDDKRISDFHNIKVKSIDSSNRRVKIINPSELQKISLKAPKNQKRNDDDDDDNNILSDEKTKIDENNKRDSIKPKENVKRNLKPVPNHHEDDDDDDEEEVEEENDEEEDECDLEGDDDDDIEDDDEGDDD